MSEPLPMWTMFPALAADDVHNQGAVDSYVEQIWLPYWQTLGEEAKADYLDRHGASAAWRAAIAFRYEWDGIDEQGDPIWRTPGWLRPVR